MDPIERVSDAVAALVGRDLTLEDAHQFLLDAAKLVAPARPVIVGGGTCGSEVRWRLGERTLAISGGHEPETPLVSVSFVNAEQADDEEFRDFKWGLVQDAPFHWTILTGPAEPGDIWTKQCACLCYNWDLFDEVFDPVFQALPHDLAKLPPAWRPQIIYQWDMSVTSLGVITVRATVDGVQISSDATGDCVTLPPGFPMGIGRILAGLAGGAPLRDVRFLESRGFAAGPTSLTGRETPDLLEQIAWMEQHNWDEFAPDNEHNKRPALTFDDLRTAVALAEADADEKPRPRTTRDNASPMRAGLTTQHLQWIAQQWLGGAPVSDLLTRELGGTPGTYLNEQAIVGTDWVAYQPEHNGEWAIIVSPAEGETWTDDQELAGAAWELCGALKAMVGAPFAGQTTSHFVYTRFFAAGERALAVDTLLGLRLRLGTFEEMKAFYPRASA